MKEKRRHKNCPEVVLPEELRLTADLKEAMAEKDILVLAVPSVYIRATAARMKEFIRYGQIVINVIQRNRGESSLKTMSQVIGGRASGGRGGRPSGPSHAEEVPGSPPPVWWSSPEKGG